MAKYTIEGSKKYKYHHESTISCAEVMLIGYFSTIQATAV